MKNITPTWFKVSKNIQPITFDTITRLYPYKPDFGRYALYKFLTSDITPEFMEILDVAELGIKHLQIFYRPGYSADMNAFIHTDGYDVIPDLAKINYVISGRGNIMKWWRPLSNTVLDKHRFKTEIGSKYLRFDEHECELLDQQDLAGLYVVNAGIPHSITMTNASIDNPRICVSITPTIKNSNKMISTSIEVINRLEMAINKIYHKGILS